MKKVIVVTGASRGIGRKISEYFLEKGHIVIGTFNKSYNEALLIKEQYPLFVPKKADMKNEEEIKKTVSEIIDEYGKIDCLINNAGVAKSGLLQDFSIEDYNEIFDTNVKGTFMFTKEVLPSMINSKGGKIINISSMWGQVGASCEVAYSAAKAGVIGLTKALAKELAPSGITVNAIAPGLIETNMNSNLTIEEISDFVSTIPLGRMGNADEIASAIEFLSSDKADYITGQVLGVNGGYVI